MTTAFEDIEIVDLELSKTTWSRVHSSMRTLYLKLSREPDLNWIRFFHQERESRVVMKRHGLWLEDGYIVFDCLLDDVQTHHLPDFRLSVAFANRCCRELQAQQTEAKQRYRESARNEQQQLEHLRERIRGDRPEPKRAAHADVPRQETVPAPAQDAPEDFVARRDEWRARLRSALATRRRNGANDDR